VLERGLLKALAHLTGGGIFDNLPRVLPEGCAAEIDRAAWPVSPLFALIQEASGLPDDELFRTFNMGIGMVMVCHPSEEHAVRETINEPVFTLGRLVSAPRSVRLV
jgi:phosphoribosylformylglycinamidine cyclo-ligase